MPPKIYNGGWKFVRGTPYIGRIPYGARIHYHCEVGYKLYGDAQLMCKRYGGWGEYPYCKPYKGELHVSGLDKFFLVILKHIPYLSTNSFNDGSHLQPTATPGRWIRSSFTEQFALRLERWNLVVEWGVPVVESVNTLKIYSSIMSSAFAIRQPLLQEHQKNILRRRLHYVLLLEGIRAAR